MTPWNTLATTRFLAYLRTRLSWDTFSHAETDSWGSPETTQESQTWTTSGGVASNFSIAAGVGTISLSTVNASRFATTASGIGDVDETISVTVPVVAATDTYSVYFLIRFVDTSNYYSLRAVFDTSGTVDLICARLLAGSSTTLGTANDEVAYAAGTTVKLRFQGYGTNLGVALKGKIWLSTDDEPDEWTLDDIVDNTPELLLGGVGIRAIMSAANTNSLPVAITFDDFTAYSPPQWTDLTTYVSIAQSLGADVEGYVGRQTELSDIDPARLSLAIKNQSGWFTPQNSQSPYFPDWQAGVPLRWTETLGARTFRPVPDMVLEIPEVSASTWLVDDETSSDRTLFLSGIDVLTKLKRAPRFVSNLATYIVGEAPAGTLRAYWPLTDASGSTYANSAGPVAQDPLRFGQVDTFSPTTFIDTLISFGGQDGPFGEDASVVEFTPTEGAMWGRLGNSEVVHCDPTATGVATFVVWVYVPDEVTTLDQLALVRDLATFDIAILFDPLGGDEWMATFGTAGGSDTALTAGSIERGWHLLGGQIDFATGDIAFWRDTVETTGNTGGSGTNGQVFDRVVLDGGEDTSTGLRMAHVQLYIGDYTHDDFLAQYDVGMNGWPKQRVDERIEMVCRYAGFTNLDLEESDSLMQAPRFANQRPGDLAAAAATTGGGILFARDDKLVYHDRKHRFGL